MTTCGEVAYLLLGLQYRKLWGAQYAGRDKLQAELVLLLVAVGNYLANECLNLRYEPYQDGGIEDVEGGMECCQYERQ